MREILFRAKRKNNRGWICGSFVKKVSGVYIISESITGCIADYTEHEVDPETVCQYTGLTDKNGRKIFEGDIVNCSERRGAAFWRCKVQWNEARARFDVINADCAFPMCLDDCRGTISINGSDYEVISNIFDNPELVESNS